MTAEEVRGVEDGVEADAGEEDHELHVDVDRHEQTDLLAVSQTPEQVLDNSLVQESQVIVPGLVETDLLRQVIRELETTHCSSLTFAFFSPWSRLMEVGSSCWFISSDCFRLSFPEVGGSNVSWTSSMRILLTDSGTVLNDPDEDT